MVEAASCPLKTEKAYQFSGIPLSLKKEITTHDTTWMSHGDVPVSHSPVVGHHNSLTITYFGLLYITFHSNHWFIKVHSPLSSLQKDLC